jgi:CspA family cold shock protein
MIGKSRGKVKFYNEGKGYGFIIPDDPEVDELFFHASKLLDKVTKDDFVLFEIVNTKKGLQAINVKKQLN